MIETNLKCFFICIQHDKDAVSFPVQDKHVNEPRIAKSLALSMNEHKSLQVMMPDKKNVLRCISMYHD